MPHLLDSLCMCMHCFLLSDNPKIGQQHHISHPKYLSAYIYIHIYICLSRTRTLLFTTSIPLPHLRKWALNEFFSSIIQHIQISLIVSKMSFNSGSIQGSYFAHGCYIFLVGILQCRTGSPPLSGLHNIDSFEKARPDIGHSEFT